MTDNTYAIQAFELTKDYGDLLVTWSVGRLVWRPLDHKTTRSSSAQPTCCRNGDDACVAPWWAVGRREPDIRLWPVRLAALGERLLLMRSHFYSIADMGHVFEKAGAGIVAAEEGSDFNVRLAVEREGD